MVTQDTTNLLSIHGLCTRFGSHTIHQGLDLDVLRGELLVLFGGSGTGKSTLLRTIIGLETSTAGTVVLENQELTKLAPADLREVRRKIGYAFQNGALFDNLTVSENLEYPLQEFTELGRKERRSAAAAMLARVGLADAMDLYPAELSGGMQKRVGIARTLMLDPALILYDEPTAGLDPANTKIIVTLMRELKEAGKTGILVTHDVPSALAVGDRIAFLHDGKIAVVQERAALERAPDERIAAYINGDIA